jgi:hypothetical protein
MRAGCATRPLLLGAYVRNAPQSRVPPPSTPRCCPSSFFPFFLGGGARGGMAGNPRVSVEQGVLLRPLVYQGPFAPPADPGPLLGAGRYGGSSARTAVQQAQSGTKRDRQKQALLAGLVGPDVRLLNIGDYISGKESPMAVSWLLCVAVSWRPAYVILAVIYIFMHM